MTIRHDHREVGRTSRPPHHLRPSTFGSHVHFHLQHFISRLLADDVVKFLPDRRLRPRRSFRGDGRGLGLPPVLWKAAESGQHSTHWYADERLHWFA